MNIDKNNLRLGIWYEDKDGNKYRSNGPEKPNESITSYHVCFPMEISERIEFYYNNKDTCKHPLKSRKRTTGWVKGIKGCKCQNCGKTKTGKSYIPFALMKWEEGNEHHPVISRNTCLGTSSQDCVVAMVNSGDYKLDEALVIMATACERCMNVLEYKYLDGKEGYKEFSDEWKKANTECEFCKNIDK